LGTDAVQEVFINSVVGQSEFLVSLALALSGACIWLIVWIAQKRLADESVTLRWVPTLALAVTLAAGSLLFALFARGQIIASIGEIYEKMTAPDKFSETLRGSEKLLGLAEIAQIQIALLAASILTLTCFALRNAGIVIGKPSKKKRKG
jgi:hypothetical protein